jgi:hypothetical protein
MSVDVSEKQTELTAPATRWRNRWRTANGATFKLRPPRPPGEYLSEIVYPSKEIAEHRAREIIARYIRWYLRGGMTYLGAVPDEGRGL